MTAVKVHATLLVLAMIVAFQTMTRDESPTRQSAGENIVWEGDSARIVSVAFENPTRTLLIERRSEPGVAGGPPVNYLWGVSDAKNATTDSTSRAQADHEEFPLGEQGDQVLGELGSLHALRELGVLSDSAKTEYALTDPERTLTVRFDDGEKHLRLGGTVFGAPHRYAVDPETDQGYVISNEVIRNLEAGRITLQSTRLHTFDLSRVAAISVQAPSGSRSMIRDGTGSAAIWTRPDAPGEADQTFANFMDRLEQLALVQYDVSLNPDTLTSVVRIEYTGTGDVPLGYLELYSGPADSQGIVEYYLRTELTRIPARASASVAGRVAQDLADMFGG